MNQPKVLIADDRVENLVALEHLLCDLDIEIVRALSGNEAISKTLEFEFALALIDVQMPEMDGFETLDLLRQNKHTKNLPVIFVTANYYDEYSKTKGIEQGAVDFLTKPIVPSILLGKIRVFLDLYIQKQQLSESVKERDEALKELGKYRDHLEKTVDDRTVELEKVNKGLEKEITYRKKVEEGLRSSEENFRLLTENSVDCIWTMDKRLRFTYLSPSFYYILGYKPKECIGKGLNTFTRRLSFVKVARLALQIIRSQTINPYLVTETELIAKSGEEIPVEITSKILLDRNEKVIGLQGSLKNISERIVAHNALVESENRFRTLYDNSPDMFASIAPETMKIKLCNNALLHNLGYSKTEIIGKSVEMLCNESCITEVQKIFGNILKNNSVKDYELTLRKKDGSIIDVSLNTEIIKSEDEKIKTYLTSWRDITEKKKSEKLLGEQNEEITRQIQEIKKLNQEYLVLNKDLYNSNAKLQAINLQLEEAKDKAEESDRLKSAFLANMSHEIRTPMNAIIGFSNLLLDNSIEKDKIHYYLQLINNSGQSLLQLINDIIDLSKIEAKQLRVSMSNCNLYTAFNNCYELFSKSRIYSDNPDVELILDVPKNICNFNIQTDPIRLEQVLNNLINNALKFTKKGYVKISHRIKKNEKGNYLEVSVKDTGIGIPKEKADIIFKRFRQVQEMEYHEGAGLGLSISKGIVEIMGGDIWFESKPNEGSTFYFTLPFKPVLNITEKPDDRRFRNLNLADKSVFIAEDDSNSYAYLEELLSETDIKIKHAQNGKELMDLLNESTPDLILLDINMPIKTGFECLKEIKEKGINVKIIAQTAYAMLDEEERCICEGCNGYISKPFKKKEMFREIEKVLEL